MDFALINKFFILIIDFLSIWLATFIFRQNDNKTLRRVFFVMIPAMLLWVNCAFFARIVDVNNVRLSEFLLRVAWFVTPIVFYSLYWFIITLFELKEHFRLVTYFLIAVTAVASLSVFAGDTIIAGFQRIDLEFTIVYGDYMLLFLLLISVLMVPTVYALFYSIRHRKNKGVSLRYVIVGVVVFYLMNLVFNIAFPIYLGITFLYFLGDYSLIILLITLVFASYREEIFGVKIIVTETLVALISILLLLNFLNAEKIEEFLIQGIILIGFIWLGMRMIKGVKNEKLYADMLEDKAQQLETANDKLKKLDEAKTEFLSITSHQLRTPLSSIKGYLSMILDGDFGKFSQEQGQALNRVYSELERLIRLVQVFLNVSRIESGRLKIAQVDFDMSELVNSVVEQLRYLAEDKGLEIEYKKTSEHLPYVGDPDKLKDVIVNLVDNAIKYTPKGRVWLEAGANAHNLVVEVHDTGVGIEKDYADELFEKFSRAKGIAQIDAGGTGLGLFIVKKIVEGHHGTIRAESEGPGQGTTFVLTLPLDKLPTAKEKG